MLLDSATPEYGEAYEETQIKKEGDDISIGLNAQYLMDILKATDKEEVTLSMSDSLKPVLMKPVGNDGLSLRDYADAVIGSFIAH